MSFPPRDNNSARVSSTQKIQPTALKDLLLLVSCSLYPSKGNQIM